MYYLLVLIRSILVKLIHSVFLTTLGGGYYYSFASKEVESGRDLA